MSTLSDLHQKRLDWLSDRLNQAKKDRYQHVKSAVQAKIRKMKEEWWKEKARQIQSATNKNDLRAFYQELKAIHGPSFNGMSAVRSSDGRTILTDPTPIRERWAEHFEKLLNRPSNIADAVLEDLPSRPTLECLGLLVWLDEVTMAISELKNGKAPGSDSLPPEVFKYGGPYLAEWLIQLFTIMWQKEINPQDFKDVKIIHLYKRKGKRADCNNYRGISLLCIAGKIFTHKIVRWATVLAEEVNPESQCGHRENRGTVDMLFAAHQVQEKYREQQRNLYIVFADLTKAFDSVSCARLWMLLHKVGFRQKVINII